MASRKKIRLVLIGVLILTGILFILFNNHGVIRYMQLKDEAARLQYTIDSIKTENARLEAAIDSLERKVPAKIEQAARENYDMLRKGETKVEIIEK